MTRNEVKNIVSRMPYNTPIVWYNDDSKTQNCPIIFFDEEATQQAKERERQKWIDEQTDKLMQSQEQSSSTVQTAVPQRFSHNTLNKSADSNDDFGVIVPDKCSAYKIAQTFIRTVCIKVYGEAIYIYTGCYYKKLSDSDAKRTILQFCRESIRKIGTSKCLADILAFVRHEPTLIFEPTDENTRFVSFKNGVLDIDDGKLYPHNSRYFTTYCIECDYCNNKTFTPNFDRFLAGITGSDSLLQERIYQMIGYILTPDTSAKVLFLLQGCSNSGKSVLSSFIRSLFNEDSVSDIDIHELSERFAASDLEGKALCISPDLPSEPLDAKSVSKLKQFTGNDIVSADVKYKDRVKFRCVADFILATNHPLLTKGDDEAFFRRIVQIPFNYSVPKERQDYCLLDKLQYERSGVVSKAINAYYRLKQCNYTFAGEYDLNSVYGIYHTNTTDTNITAMIYSYLVKIFKKADDNGIYMTDVYNDFINTYEVSISLNAFSKCFTRYAEKEFGAAKQRKRKPGTENPVSYIFGISRKN